MVRSRIGVSLSFAHRHDTTMIIALLGVLFLVSCILAYFSARTWNWLHVTAVLLTFVMGALSLVLTANYLAAVKKYRTAYDQNYADLQEARLVGRRLKYGDPMKDIQDEPTVVELAGKFNRLVYQRGRVWRSAVPMNANGNQIQLRLVPDNAPAGASHGVAQGIVLFAFLEQIPLDRDGDGQEDLVDRDGDGQANEPILRLPGAYLGEFLVTATDEKTITLQPSLTLDQLQQNLVKQNATWALYEVMPLDGHFVFAKGGVDDVVEYVEPNDEVKQDVFGEMNEVELRKVFELAVARNFPQMPPAQQTQYVDFLVGPYLRDGKPLTVDEARQEPEQVVWYKVKFLKPHSITVDASTPSVSETRSFFDTQGLAVDPRLMRGDTVTFKKDEIGLFMKGNEDVDEGGREIIDDDLDDWLEQGICELITPVYVRPLNGYQDDFQLIASRGQRVDEDIRLININIAQWQESKKYCDSQIVYRRDEKAKLDGEGLPEGQIGELPGFQRDVQALDNLLTALAKQKATVLEELSRLYQTNAALRDQLAAVQAFLKEQLEKQSPQAVTLR